MMKELVMQVTKDMPDDATIEEILEAILVKLSVMKGLKDIEDGKFTTQEDLLKEIKEW